GMPGDVITIRNGELIINGRPALKPAHLSFLHYLSGSELPGFSKAADTEVQLGPDEYYLLGDFSRQSFDSRLFTEGAPGHPPYAVPANHIVGVVTHIYWPVDRWRVFERKENE